MRKGFVFLLVLVLLASCIATIQPAKASKNSWKTMAPMPEASSGHGVAVANGKIYAIGGTGKGGYLNITLEYDPATNTWTTKKPMPTARCDFGIAVYQNKIYVIGGRIGSDWVTGEGILCSFNEVYDPLTDTWETKTSMPTKRDHLCANVVNGKIYLLGGSRYQSYPYSVLGLDVNEVYDPSTDSWTTKAPLPTAVYGYASAVVNNKIYVISGLREPPIDSNPFSNLNQIYDPETNTWSYGAPIPTAVNRAAAGATTGDTAPKEIYVMGGYPSYDECDLNQVYNPETDTWSTGAPMPTPRHSFGVAVVNDVLYAIGGGSSNLNWRYYAENEQYTPFVTVQPPVDRPGPPAVYIFSPENNTVNNVSLTFTVNEPTSWIGYSLNGQANVTIAGNTTLTELSNVSHSLKVYANDTAGNMGSSEAVYFTISHETQPSEPFPTTWLIAAVVTAAVASAGLLFYLKKRKH
jgi:N-acetylneuraminic acid mutarotase